MLHTKKKHILSYKLEYYAKKEQETGQFNALVFLINKYIRKLVLKYDKYVLVFRFCYKEGRKLSLLFRLKPTRNFCESKWSCYYGRYKFYTNTAQKKRKVYKKQHYII